MCAMAARTAEAVPADLQAEIVSSVRALRAELESLLCYGPHAGDIHGIDEWVSLDSACDVAAVIALLLADWCKVERC